MLRRWSSVGAECASHRNLPHALSYQLVQSITTGSPVASFSHFKSQNHSKPEANIPVKNRGKLLVLKLRLICNMESPLVYEPCIKFGKGKHTKLFAHIMILKYIYLGFPTCKQVDCTLWYYLVNTPLYIIFLIIIIFKIIFIIKIYLSWFPNLSQRYNKEINQEINLHFLPRQWCVMFLCKQVDCIFWYYLVNTPLCIIFLIIIIF